MEKVENVSILMEYLKFAADARTPKQIDSPSGSLDLTLQGKITKIYNPKTRVYAMRDLCNWCRCYIADSQPDYTILEKLLYTVITYNKIPYKYLDFSIKMCEKYYQYCDKSLWDMPKFARRRELCEVSEEVPKDTTADERRMIEQMNAVLLPMFNYVDDKTKKAIQWTLKKINGGD